mgnify:CR=1 FL=1
MIKLPQFVWGGGITMRYFEVIRQYVDVCNRAIMNNHGKFPFSHILGAAKDAGHQDAVEVNISNVHPVESYVFSFGDTGINVKPHVFCDGCNCVRSWDTDLVYLQRVIDNPDCFITNPALLNWEWAHDAL